MNIAIYQIDPDRDENNVVFLNYENLERFQGPAALRSEIYDKVFEGEVECGTLEEVYQMFNLDHPDGYRGRSLSVSDVIEVIGEEKSTFLFCDSIGFREVDFDPDMTSCATILSSTPSCSLVTSLVSLSVVISRIASPALTASPSCLSQPDTVPSSIVSPNWGIRIS